MGLRVDEGLEIPDEDLSWSAARSAGPGGQNVNKVSTRVTVVFDLAGSRVLDEAQKALIAERLATRIDKAGGLHVVAQRHRTQSRNRDAAFERLAELLREALHVDPPRRETRPTRSSREERLEGKRRRADAKRGRSEGRRASHGDDD